MPAEIFNLEEFIKLSESALECRVKRTKGIVKLKLRTKRRLYTIKLKENEAEEALKKIKCPIVEI
jgi:large subunit ribosomal protein L38e